MNVDELIAKNKALLDELSKSTGKRNRCKKCGKEISTGKYCESCDAALAPLRAKQRAAKVHTNGKGYKYVTDENGKVVMLARKLMEEMIGRPLEDHWVVLYRDGNKRNVVKENLVLGYKGGTSFDVLTCKQCGARGSAAFGPSISIPKGEVRGTEGMAGSPRNEGDTGSQGDLRGDNESVVRSSSDLQGETSTIEEKILVGSEGSSNDGVAESEASFSISFGETP